MLQLLMLYLMHIVLSMENYTMDPILSQRSTQKS